jgi:hypothetical protein
MRQQQLLATPTNVSHCMRASEVLCLADEVESVTANQDIARRIDGLPLSQK